MLGPVLTLVVVTRDRVVRAEFASRRAVRPSSVVVSERPETDDPVAAVAAALGRERRSPGNVYVLSSDVWTRTLRVASLNLRNLSATEMQQSLAFEAEPLSGLSPLEAATAVVPPVESQGVPSAWIGQIAAETLAEIDDVVRGTGGKLQGVLHPAGVPGSWPVDEAAATMPVARVEFWADATVYQLTEAKHVVSLRVEDSAATANRERLVDDFARQSGASAQVEMLIPDFRAATGAERTFADEALFEQWLSAWRRALTARHPAVPVVRPSARPLSAGQRRNIAVVLGCLALGACMAHGYWIRQGIEAATAEQARVEEPGQQLAAMQQRQAEAEKSLTKLREEVAKRKADVGQAQEMLAAHRRRLGELLDRLGKESSQQWVLREISGTPRDLKLVGVTMHPEHISVLAADLAVDLADLGWAVEPPKHMARNQQNDGGPWSFELRLRDETIAPRTAPTTKPAAPAGSRNLVRVPTE